MNDLPPPDDTASDLIDEAARRAFERAWREGRSPPLEPFLPPPDHPGFLPTLLELVLIDLEFAWKTQPSGSAETWPAAPPPRVEAYLARFPALQPAARRLLREEYRLRHLFGDRPEPTEYQDRFPDLSLDTQGFVRPAAPAPARPEVPGYEILGELGRGGMGVVYKARQVSLNRVVALKMISAGALAGTEEVARFRREAEAVAKLGHPNVVHIYEVGAWEGRPYFAMEFVDGGGLDRVLAATPQPPRWSAELSAVLARAVHAVHGRGIVHRDLKPANVLIGARGQGPGTREDKAAVSSPTPDPWPLTPGPKIADFGLAKSLTETAGHTASGAVLGTPSYMSPEQAEGRKDVGPAADVYALGVILYECLTGRPPFKGATVEGTLVQVLTQEPVPPSRLAPQVPHDLETICLKCLEKEPARRYASAGELADDLGRFLAGEPIRARPTPAWERALKWARRKPAAAGLLGVSVAAVVALGTVGLTYHLALREALDDAENRRTEADEAKGREEQRRREAEANLEEARGNFGLAREAVDNYITRVGEDPRLRGYDLEGLRHDLLRSAKGFYEKLVQRRHGDTPAVRSEQSRTYMRLAGLSAQLGDRADAEAQYLQAVALLEPLAREGTGDPVDRPNLGHVFNNLSTLYQETGRPDLAEDAMKRSLAIREQLVRDRPGDAQCRAELADGYVNQGRLDQSHGRGGRAEAAFRKALQLYQGLVEERRDDRRLRFELSRAWFVLGGLLDKLRRDGEAADAFGEAGRLQKALVKARPGEPGYQDALGRTHAGLATLHAHARRYDQAASALRDALKVQEPLAQAHPRILAYHAVLGNSYHNLGAVLRFRGEWGDAADAYAKALAVRERLHRAHPDGVPQQVELAVTSADNAVICQDLGRLNQAEAHFLRAQQLLKRLAEREPQLPDRLDQLAQNHFNLATLWVAARKLDQAEGAFLKGLELYKQLAEKHPGVVSYRADRARCLGSLGALYNDMRRPAQAEKTNREAVRLQKELADAFPAEAGHRADLANSLTYLGVSLLLQEGRVADAEAQLHAARKILEEMLRAGPKAPEQVLSLVATYSNLGNAGLHREDAVAALRWFGRAARATTELLRDEPRHAKARYSFNMLHRSVAALEQKAGADVPAALLVELAGTYALSVAPAKQDPSRAAAARDKLAEGYAVKAIALLRRARDAGYFDDAGRVDRLKADPAFAALRDRADFREILVEKAGK